MNVVKKPVFNIEKSQTLWACCAKRLFDIVAALLLLLILSPLLLVTAILVKVTSRGPVFFSQLRGGLLGRPFRLYKFRTMRGGRKPDIHELVPLDHPEITSLGRVLRRSKIDELPQLWHVVTGKMSLIGPRPTLLDQIETYDDFRRQRLLVRPGATGLAQVHAPSLTSWEERILFDIAYVRRCSFSLDIMILGRTILVVIFGEQFTAKPFHTTRFAEFVTPPEEYLSHEASRPD